MMALLSRHNIPIVYDEIGRITEGSILFIKIPEKIEYDLDEYESQDDIISTEENRIVISRTNIPSKLEPVLWRLRKLDKNEKRQVNQTMNIE